MRNIKRQRGIGLVEIMVSLVIALFLLLGIGTIFLTTRSTYGSQQGLSNLQDNERLAMVMLTNVIQTGGYFPNPDATTAPLSLLASGAYAVDGQPVSGSYNAAGSDTVSARFVTATGDSIENCNGGTNSSGGNVIYDNVFSIQPDPSNNNTPTLYCSVNGANPQPLVSGVATMKVLYGVDTTGSALHSINQYMNQQQVTAAASWSKVRSVLIQLTFINPMAALPGQPANLPPFTTIVPVMNAL